MNTLQKLKPNNYIETRWELKEGYRFTNPVQYLNDKKYYDYPENSHERQNWGSFYWKSKQYDDAKNIILADSKFWKSDKLMHKAFEISLDYLKTEKIGSTTPMFPFEIWLMHHGFELKTFGGLNALAPTGRSFEKEGIRIVTNFGFSLLNDKFERIREVNFYFYLSAYPKSLFQVPIDSKDFEKSIKGELKDITKL